MNYDFIFLQRNWNLNSDNFFYFQHEDKKKNDEVVPSLDLARKAINYARELEMIV